MSSVFPGAIDSFTNPAGTNTLDSPDHALQHTDTNSAIFNIESVIGTTNGTSVLQNFASGDFAARVNIGGTLTQTLYGGTLSGNTFTAPNFASGTLQGTSLTFKNMAYGLFVSSSTSPIKGDYTCDGTADEVQIQAALTLANGTIPVVLSGGTFNIASPLSLYNSSVLAGNGIGQTIIKQQDSIQDNVIIASNKTDIQLRDFSIDGNKANNASGDNGIYFDGCSRFTVSNVESYNNKLKGFVVGSDVAASSDGLFLFCEAHDNAQDGIALASGTANLCSRISVIGGNYHDNTLYGIGLDTPLYTYLQNQNHLIMGNICKDNGSYGIEVFGAKGARIIGNHIEGSGNHGIDLGSTGGGTTTSFYVNNCIISNNVVKNQTAAGYSNIQMTAVYNSIITGNECIDDQGTALTAYGIFYNSGTGNKVFNNNVRGATTSAAEVYGIDGNGGAANITALVNPFSGNGTIDVSGITNLRVSMGTAGTVLAFNNGAPGQMLSIHTVGTNFAIPDSGNFKLASAFSSTGDDTITLRSVDGTIWNELARSVN